MIGYWNPTAQTRYRHYPLPLGNINPVLRKQVDVPFGMILPQSPMYARQQISGIQFGNGITFSGVCLFGSLALLAYAYWRWNR